MPVFEFFVFWVAFDWFCSFARHRKQSADWLILRNTVLQVIQTSQNQAIRGSAAAPAASLVSLSPVAGFAALHSANAFLDYTILLQLNLN